MQGVKLFQNLEVSRPVYGMWRLTDYQNMSAGHIRNKLAARLDQGINTIDEADIYGDKHAEEIFVKALQGTPMRNQTEIVTKCDIATPFRRFSAARLKYYDTSQAHILNSVEHSLGLMHTDHTDLLLLYRPDPLTSHFETGAALHKMVASGKVGAVGTSNFQPHDWNPLQSIMKTPLVTNQFETSSTANRALIDGDIAFYQTNATPMMACSPFASGALFNGKNQPLKDLFTSIAQTPTLDLSAVAVTWHLANRAQIIAVMGTNKITHIEHLYDALKVPTGRQACYVVYTAALVHEVPE